MIYVTALLLSEWIFMCAVPVMGSQGENEDAPKGKYFNESPGRTALGGAQSGLDNQPHNAHPPVTSWYSVHSGERLDAIDKGKSEQQNAEKTQCFRTCLCHIVEIDTPDLTVGEDQIPRNVDSMSVDKGLDIDFHKVTVVDVFTDVTNTDKQQWKKWHKREALHVECNSRQFDVKQFLPEDLHQEIIDRLYNVSEVIINQAASLELPTGLCEMEAEVKQLTWTNISLRHLPNKNSSNLAACLPLLTTLKLTHNLDLATLSSLPLLAKLPSHLQDLILSHNNISVIPTSTFSTTPSLLKLDLSHNTLQSLDIHSLANLTALKYLNLSFNGLKYLHSQGNLESFWGKIDWLDLQHNSLEEMPSFLKLSPLQMTRRGKFRPPWSMAYLDLSHNKIEHLETGIFAHTVNLKHLDLSFNFIHSILQGVFTQTLSNLLHLKLSYNRISHLPGRALDGLARLQMLNFSHNQLTGVRGVEFTGGLTPNTPDTSGNVIFNYTLSWTDLQVLDLSYNNISYISRGAFQVFY